MKSCVMKLIYVTQSDASRSECAGQCSAHWFSFDLYRSESPKMKNGNLRNCAFYATGYSISISITAQKVIHFPITITAEKSIEYQ